MRPSSNAAGWLSRVQRFAPGVSEESLAAAREKLNAQWQAGLPAVVEESGELCPTCGGQGAIRLNPAASPGDPDFGKVKPCPHPWHTQARLRTLAKISNLSPAELEIRLSDCQVYDNQAEYCELPIQTEDGTNLTIPRSNVEMLETFKELAKDPLSDSGMLYVMGPWGGGKTYAAMGLVNEINLNNQGPAMYITLPDLYGFLKAAFDDRNRSEAVFGGWSFDRRYETIAQAKVLVVDEFDFSDSKVKGTEYNLEILQRWFNARYRSGVTRQTLTVLISNSPIEALELGGLSSRMSDGRFRTIFNTAPDWRPGQGCER